jgi:hypothetical protein
MLRIDAGRYCENRWRELSLQTAMKKEEKREQSLKTLLKVRSIQEPIQNIPLKRRSTRTVQDTLEDVGDDVDAALKSQRMSRVRRLKLKRPKGAKGESAKAAVIAEAVIWFKELRGITVKPFRMRRFWDEFRRTDEYKRLKI